MSDPRPSGPIVAESALPLSPRSPPAPHNKRHRGEEGDAFGGKRGRAAGEILSIISDGAAISRYLSAMSATEA